MLLREAVVAVVPVDAALENHRLLTHTSPAAVATPVVDSVETVIAAVEDAVPVQLKLM
jgi:hypothetical protein